MDVDELSELDLLESGLTGWDRFKAINGGPKTVFDKGRIALSLADSPFQFKRRYESNEPLA